MILFLSIDPASIYISICVSYVAFILLLTSWFGHTMLVFLTVPGTCTNGFCPSDLLSWKSDVVEFHVPPVAQNCYMIIFSCKGAWEIKFFF